MGAHVEGDGRSLEDPGDPESLRLKRLPSHLSHPDSTKAMLLAWLHHNPGSGSGLLSQGQPKMGPKFSHTKKILLGQKDPFRS